MSRVWSEEQRADIGNGVWQLVEILTRAKLTHLHEELVTNGVDLSILAHSTEPELESLGVKSKGERLKVQRFARAWETLYGA